MSDLLCQALHLTRSQLIARVELRLGKHRFGKWAWEDTFFRDMPFVQQAFEAAQIKIQYEALPNGAQITFTTQDLALITAIHRWFGAQLSDHGSDAIYREENQFDHAMSSRH